jgi:hypothetical protein
MKRIQAEKDTAYYKLHCEKNKTQALQKETYYLRDKISSF